MRKNLNWRMEMKITTTEDTEFYGDHREEVFTTAEGTEKKRRTQRMKRILILVLTGAIILGLTNQGTIFAQAMGKKPTEEAKEKDTQFSTDAEKHVIKKQRILKDKEKIKFIDKKGRIFKEISLQPEIKIEEVEVKQGPKGILKRQRIKKEIRKMAVMSKNGKFVGIVSNEHDIAEIYEDGKEESFKGEGSATGEITILGIDGKVVLEKKMSENRWVHYKPLMSENVEYVAVFTQNISEMPPEGRDIIYVFDKNGEEILAFPTEEEYKSGYRASDIPQAISPNGRYLAIYIEKDIPNKSSPIMTRFYDLKKNTFWDSEKRYLIWNITNEGIAEVDYYDIVEKKRSKTELINLKEHLGE